MDKYLKFHNDPEKYHFKRDKYKKDDAEKDIKVKLKPMTSKKPFHVGKISKQKTSEDQWALKLTYPIAFDVNEGDASGVIDFGLKISFHNQRTPEKHDW